MSREESVIDVLNCSIGTSVNGGTISSVESIGPGGVPDDAGSTFVTKTITFTSPVGPLTSGNTYYLNFETTDEKVYYLGYNGSDDYSSGTYYKGGGDDGKDMFFEVSGILHPLTGSDDSDYGAPLAAASAAGAELPPAMLSASGVELTTNHAPTVAAPARTDSTTSSSTPLGSSSTPLGSSSTPLGL